MKIRKIYIKKFDQFQDISFDFTNPETGKVADKICLIGQNGTGKSKLLMLIIWLFKLFLSDFIFMDFVSQTRQNSIILSSGRVIFEVIVDNKIFFFYLVDGNIIIFENEVNELSNDDLIKKLLIETLAISIFRSEFWSRYIVKPENEVLNKIQLKDNNNDLFIYSPAESDKNDYRDMNDVPDTSVSEALDLSKNFPFYAEVSSHTVREFWKILVFNLRKRAEERETYEILPENINKTKAQLIDEFDRISPQVLEHLALIWNKILGKAGLEFDVEGASNPYQLNDNLKAYVRLIKSNTIIPYSALSTGIRNYIFRIGHIFSVYFNRKIDRAILLVDEPENSLYPDFLFELIETYQQIIIDKRGQNNTQMFFATHNPIIAAQFKPHERIILEWKEDGTVKANKGITPEGDDPNDILKKDFGLHQLMGPVGIQEWHKYLGLKRKLKATASVEDKMTIASEINKIGQLYNFPA